MSIQDMEDLKQQYLDKMKTLIIEFLIKDYRDEKIDIKINELKENFNRMSIEINKNKKLQQLERVANLSTYPSRLFNSFCYDDDDDDDEEYTIAITPVLPTEEPDNSLNTSIISSPKIDSLLEEFSSELAHIDLIPPGINETDFDPDKEIRLVEKLLYDNSSPRPPEEFNSENSNIESFFPSHIPVEDSDSLMEEIDLFLTPDDSMPPGIENDDYGSEGDILFLEELHSNDSPSLPENESFHFDV
ncbi:hypothetical protein Tco_0785847 [Tanacetum coccineum]